MYRQQSSREIYEMLKVKREEHLNIMRQYKEEIEVQKQQMDAEREALFAQHLLLQEQRESLAQAELQLLGQRQVAAALEAVAVVEETEALGASLVAEKETADYVDLSASIGVMEEGPYRDAALVQLEVERAEKEEALLQEQKESAEASLARAQADLAAQTVIESEHHIDEEKQRLTSEVDRILQLLKDLK
jgi:hypothetical protein